jgi:hypothetical protein
MCVQHIAYLKAAVQKARSPAHPTPANISSEEHPKTVRVTCSERKVLPLLMLLLGDGMLLLSMLLLLLLAVGRRILLRCQALLPCSALVCTDLWVLCVCNKAALCLMWPYMHLFIACMLQNRLSCGLSAAVGCTAAAWQQQRAAVGLLEHFLRLEQGQMQKVAEDGNGRSGGCCWQREGPCKSSIRLIKWLQKSAAFKP